MHDEKDKMHFTKEGYYVCSLCECSVNVHVYFYTCSLLDKEKICVDCCHTDIPTDEVIPKLKDLGKEITREEIDEICKECKFRCVGETLDDI